MSRTLSLAMLLSAFAQETEDAIIPLLVISPPGWPGPIRAAMNGEDIVSGGETYTAYPFDIVVPDESPDRPPQVTITIDNVSRQITAALESASAPVPVDIKIIRGSAPDLVEVSWTGLALREVKYNKVTISGTLSYKNLSRESYPRGIFSPAYFPGIH